MASLIAFSLPATAHAAPAQRAGVQLHVLWSDVGDAEMDHQLDLVQQSGAAMARVDVGWASLQEKGPDDWEPYHLRRLDRLVDGAQARGIQLLLIFMNSPCWASSAPDTLKQGCAGSWWSRGVSQYAPNDPQDYARALAHVVARYKGRVAGWELWNEPNSSSYFKASDPAAAYASLVKAAYPLAKAADPSTTILAGALSQSDYRFTQRLYDLGIKGSFDAFSVHPYSDDISPLDPRSYTDAQYSFVRGVPKIHDTMLANGDSSPMWLTESGWSTSTVRASNPWRNGVSESDQALFMRQQAQQIQQWPWVKVNIWYELNDVGSDRADVFSNCGLRRVDGTAKPAWATFREAAALLQQEAAVGGEAPSAEPPSGDTPPASGDSPPVDGTPAPSGGGPTGTAPNPGPAGPAPATPVPASRPAPAQQPGGAPAGPVALTPSGASDAEQQTANRARHARRAAARARAKARKAAAAAKRARQAAARGRMTHRRLKVVLHRATVARRQAKLAVSRSHAATAAVAAVART